MIAVQVRSPPGMIHASHQILHDTGDPDPFVTTVQQGSTAAPLFVIPGCGDPLTGLPALAEALTDAQPLHLLNPAAFDACPATLNDLAAALIASMKRVRPGGPWHLLGHSHGGQLAWAIACRLAREREPLGALILLECHAPGYPVSGSRLMRTTLKLVNAIRKEPAAVSSLLGKHWQRGWAGVLAGRRNLFDAGDDAEPDDAERARLAGWSGIRQLATRHVHQPWPGRLYVVRARNRTREPGMADDDPACGWRPLAGRGVCALSIAGDPAGMLSTETATPLADHIRHCLENANRRPRLPLVNLAAPNPPTSHGISGPWQNMEMAATGRQPEIPRHAALSVHRDTLTTVLNKPAQRKVLENAPRRAPSVESRSMKA